MAISRTSFVELNSAFRFQWEEAQDCYVLLFPEGMVQLNETAGEILKHCERAIMVDALISRLEQEFPDADELADDVLEFLQDAYEQQWLKLS